MRVSILFLMCWQRGREGQGDTSMTGASSVNTLALFLSASPSLYFSACVCVCVSLRVCVCVCCFGCPFGFSRPFPRRPDLPPPSASCVTERPSANVVIGDMEGQDSVDEDCDEEVFWGGMVEEEEEEDELDYPRKRRHVESAPPMDRAFFLREVCLTTVMPFFLFFLLMNGPGCCAGGESTARTAERDHGPPRSKATADCPQGTGPV